MYSLLAISGSGLTAERLRMDLIASNIANIETTRSADGGPYRRRVAVFREKLEEVASYGGVRGAGVEVAAILRDNSPPRVVYSPDHPDANEDGYVYLPDIDIVNEMVDLITATRAYEANVTVINASKSMAVKALDIGRA